MNINLIMMVVMLAVAGLALLCLNRTKKIHCANIGVGQHNGNVTYKTDAAITTRYLLGKIGSDAAHVAVSDAADIPLGVITDEAAAAEDLVNLALFGSGEKTLKVVASAAIAAGAFVVGADGGKTRTLPAVAGTYYIVGRALNAAAADGDTVEIDPIPCVQRVVA